MISALLLAVGFSFGSPVNYPISLAGNFGEPRPNHFHGGIDVRTGMTTGKPIFSIADGYVSRITIGLDGFGNAVYVSHPNGTTSVYCHLNKFVPQLSALADKWMYQNKTGFCDMRFKPTDFPVAKGQLIAVSGNTGASKAPHLHLEIHSTRTWSFLDPLTYLKEYVEDKTQPIAHSFMAYPQPGRGLFCGSKNKQSVGFSSTRLSRHFTAWGKVGFGIWANDYMDGSFGILGVRHTMLSVDGHVIFESNVDSIPFECNRMVNSWGDYDHYNRTNVWYLKSYAEPGNTLPILNYGEGRGIIDFNRERDYHLVYRLTDVFGNSREYSFTVQGKRQDIPPFRMPNLMNVLRYDRFNSFQRPGMTLNVYYGSLPDDVELQPKVKTGSARLSGEWCFSHKSLPLFRWCSISLRLDKPVRDHSKLYIVSHYGVDRYMGGEFQNGWVTGKIRELGASYEIEYDDEPPTMTGFSASSDKLRISVNDTKSGLKTFRGYVDGHFVLFRNIEKTKVYSCDLSVAPVVRTKRMHKLMIEATDNRDNKRVFTTTFKY